MLLGNNLYITNSLGNSVSVIDTLTNTVLKTVAVEPGPTSSTVAGNRLYINSPESKKLSVLYTEKPSLYLLSSTSPNGKYGPGSTIDVRAVFDQPLQE